MPDLAEIRPLLERIASALERATPPPPHPEDFSKADAFVWTPESGGRFIPVEKVSRVPLQLLKGIDHTASILMDNTRRFATGLPANNALLWGARGMGKSSLVKAAHAQAGEELSRSKAGKTSRLKLVEIHRETIASMHQ